MTAIDDYLSVDPEDPDLDWRDRIKARLARQKQETGLSGLDAEGDHVRFRPDGGVELIEDAETVRRAEVAIFDGAS